MNFEVLPNHQSRHTGVAQVCVQLRTHLTQPGTKGEAHLRNPITQTRDSSNEFAFVVTIAYSRLLSKAFRVWRHSTNTITPRAVHNQTTKCSTKIIYSEHITAPQTPIFVRLQFHEWDTDVRHNKAPPTRCPPYP